MDAGIVNAYVTGAMNLLLLLSALLSALTGVSTRAAGPEPVQAVAQGNTRIAAVARSVTQRAFRPVAAPPSLVASARGPVAHPFTLTTVPAWADRRRE